VAIIKESFFKRKLLESWQILWTSTSLFTKCRVHQLSFSWAQQLLSNDSLYPSRQPQTGVCRRQQCKRRSVLENTSSQIPFIGYICYNSQQRILYVYAVNTKHKHYLHTHQLLTLHSTEKAGIKLENSSQKIE